MEEKVAQNITRWSPYIQAKAVKYSLDPYLIAALIWQESSGNTYAIRVERGFWSRYINGIIANAKKTVNKYDDRWVQYPDIAATSYGLMQVMYPVAIEEGYVLKFPTELCDPDIGIDAGCKHFKRHLDNSNGNIIKALLRYNGGGNPNYPSEVLEKVSQIKNSIKL